MDFSKLKRELKEITDLAGSVPDSFKEKCFEILLNQLICEQSNGLPRKESLVDMSGSVERGMPKSDPPTGISMTTQLRVFMQKTNLTESHLTAVLMQVDNDVHFIREPSHGSIAAGQIEWALLLALKNCILNNELSVDPEAVRSICQDKGFYNAANFAKHFKSEKYSVYFKGPMEKQGEPQGLTSEGQERLAKLIRDLTSVQA